MYFCVYTVLADSFNLSYLAPKVWGSKKWFENSVGASPNALVRYYITPTFRLFAEMSILSFEGLNATFKTLVNIKYCSYMLANGIFLFNDSCCFGSLWQIKFLPLAYYNNMFSCITCFNHICTTCV